MTDDAELVDLAVPYALDAISGTERIDIERRLAVAPQAVADAFRVEVRAVRETMAAAATVTAQDAPVGLRDRLLTTTRNAGRSRWRTVVLAAAAAVVVGVGAFAAGWAVHPPTAPPTAPPIAERVLTASDVRSASTELQAGGVATIVYSRRRGEGVLVLDDAAAPPAGMGYQMWLMIDGAPTPAGVIDESSRTAMLFDLGRATALGLSVESVAGSPHPTGEMMARVLLP